MFALVKVFATTGSEAIANKICKTLGSRLPDGMIPSNGELVLGKKSVTRFSNENIEVQVDNVRDHFVVVVHTQSSPVDSGLIELFALLDAIRNARPADLLLVFPYMPYARSDKKNKPRISTMGCCIPNILSNSFKIERVLLLDPHASHIKHYFSPVADEISAIFLLIDYLEKNIFNISKKEDFVVVFSDVGSAKKYNTMAHLLKLPTAYVDKDRPDDNEDPRINRIVGDIRGKICLQIDDEILTGKTSMNNAESLMEQGAKSVYMMAIHAILADKDLGSRDQLISVLNESKIEKFIITDSVLQKEPYNLGNKFTVVSIASLLAEAIYRIVYGKSLTELHKLENVNLYY
jgi:ribose-phosphate pyrophosphokinase